MEKDNKDWRLQGQEKYLLGKKLGFKNLIQLLTITREGL